MIWSVGIRTSFQEKMIGSRSSSASAYSWNENLIAHTSVAAWRRPPHRVSASPRPIRFGLRAFDLFGPGAVYILLDRQVEAGEQPIDQPQAARWSERASSVTLSLTAAIPHLFLQIFKHRRLLLRPKS